MTARKKYERAGSVPALFIEIASNRVYETMESHHVMKLKNYMTWQQQKFIFLDFAEEIWCTYQDFLETRIQQKIPPNRYDELLKRTRNTLKTQVVIRRPKHLDGNPDIPEARAEYVIDGSQSHVC